MVSFSLIAVNVDKAKKSRDITRRHQYYWWKMSTSLQILNLHASFSPKVHMRGFKTIKTKNAYKYYSLQCTGHIKINTYNKNTRKN